MSRRLAADIETNGLLNELTTIHCLALKDVRTGEVWDFADQPGHKPVVEGLRMMEEAEMLVFHNGIQFDIPAIQKVFPWFSPKGRVLDTLVLSRMFRPDMTARDTTLVLKGKLPKNLRGSHSLEAWGYRLGNFKGDYSDLMKADGLDPWAAWNPLMQEYVVQDVEVTAHLLRHLLRIWRGTDREGKGVPHSPKSVWLEMEVAQILSRQERWGFAFDERKAEKLYVKLLAEREKLEDELQKAFPPWFASAGIVTVRKNRSVSRKDFPPIGQKVSKTGKVTTLYVKEIYSEGTEYTRLVRKTFNPSSGQHIADRLKARYGWKPTEFTPKGDPKTDEETLSVLPYTEVQLLVRYLMIAKRIGQIAEGNQAWLKKVRKGRIHGSVKTTGAVTRRMTHSNPNVAQVPSGRAEFGHECRELFTASPGFVLVGCDADALELRCLAGYMAPYDGGEYIKTVLQGDKALGTDMHSVNSRAIGLDPKKSYTIGTKTETGRDIAKVWFYAYIYGAGDAKLGAILGIADQAEAVKVGKKSRADFMKSLPALSKLVQAVQKEAIRGFIMSLDGSKIAVRGRHAALNTLLQSAGAIVMKVALVILDRTLQEKGLVPGKDYEFCANVHDELQIDVRPEHVELVKTEAPLAIKKAGEQLTFGCPLAGNADVGKTWAETH